MFTLHIAISQPLDVYTCGDVVKGAVYIKSAAPVLVDDLLVQLLCKVVTRTKGSKESFTGVNRLKDLQTASIPYCFVKRIVNTPTAISTHEPLEFEFTIPSETKRNQIEPRWRASRTFEQHAGHAIPPTWTDRHGRAQVTHMLEVVMHTGGPQDGRKVMASREIIFSPCRAVVYPDIRCTDIRQSFQTKVVRSRRNAGRRRSIVQLLVPEDKQAVDVHVDVQVPKVLYPGMTMPISISAISELLQQATRQRSPPSDDSSDEESIEHGPTVFVEGMHAYLAVRTDRRLSIRTVEHKMHDDDQIAVCNIFNRPLAIGNTPLPLNIHYPEMALRPDLIPSFKSYSLRRRYDLHLRIRLVVGDQQHHVDVATPVLILPATFRNTAGAIRDLGDRTSIRRRVSEETLPAYAEIDPLSCGPYSMTMERPPPLVF